MQVGVVPEVLPDLGKFPILPLNLTSFALSLLLVFRTNASYARWDNARKVWGGMLNRTRDITRQVRTCRTLCPYRLWHPLTTACLSPLFVQCRGSKWVGYSADKFAERMSTWYVCS